MPAPANDAVAAAPQADTLSSVPRLTSVDSRMAPVTTFWYACRAWRARALVGRVARRAVAPGSEHGAAGSQAGGHMRKLPVSGGRQGARRRVPARPRPCPSGRTCEPCCQTAHGRVHALANLVQGSRALCARQAAGAGRPAARPSARCPHGPGRQSRSARRRARGGRACTRASARSASSARTRGLSSPRSSLRTATATSSIRLGPWNRFRTARFCRPDPARATRQSLRPHPTTPAARDLELTRA